ncbi:hypothetical protein AVEN_87762-1 [Araneus ventricosus]|uniref:Uncharacterized protein n=1 Tax=Araneus ventricosus TaxID=182803 RepID=A0A4Y2JST6_ARAVE|nr:hypothetical protein AVEN_87762-1 [Araneus ventricosus]
MFIYVGTGCYAQENKGHTFDLQQNGQTVVGVLCPSVQDIRVRIGSGQLLDFQHCCGVGPVHMVVVALPEPPAPFLPRQLDLVRTVRVGGHGHNEPHILPCLGDNRLRSVDVRREIDVRGLRRVWGKKRKSVSSSREIRRSAVRGQCTKSLVYSPRVANLSQIAILVCSKLATNLT